MHIPKSTYRLQFNSGFKFEDAKKIIPYLASLGISDIYASPVFKAKAGSRHGYDIVEHNRLNPELGSEEDFNELIAEVKKNKLGWIQDIVPNHMSYSYQNRMLVDLLENGKLSRYYDFFDIDWNHYYPSLKGRLLVPIMGKFYQKALEDGEIKLTYDEDGFSLNYYDNRLPLKISTYADVLSYNLDKLKNRLGKNDPDVIKFQGLLYVIKSLSSVSESDEMYDQIKFIKGILWELYQGRSEIKDYLNEVLKIFNVNSSVPESIKLLDNLHSEQNFRLSYWKVANEEVNYRRFFNVNDLISLKMENIETFNRTHSFVLKLIKEEKINGLRVDHVDGLYNPLEYLYRLRERAKNNYIIVEKILELRESLSEEWPVEGTTGYDFMNYVNGIFCSSSEEKRFNNIYRRVLRSNWNYEEMVHSNKWMMVKSRLAGEVEKLAFIIEFISSKDRYGIDFTMNGLKSALEEILVYFPVYRTYITGKEISSEDQKYINAVFSKAEQQNPQLVNEFGYIKNLLLLNFNSHLTDEQKETAVDFVMKFQQLTGPLMAKGFEDTTLYVFNRLISLNEVGSNPQKFGILRREFHRFNRERQRNWPHSLNATSTHDTKRGEDVRARINVLSEIPGEWENKLKKWMTMNKELKDSISDENFPARNDEYFLYQNLIGSYPFNEEEKEGFIQRLKDYLIKSVREGRVNSSWVLPNEKYEEAYTLFAEKLLKKNDANNFLKDFIPFQEKVARFGVYNSLAQVLIKLTSPGVPDFYQGTELWDLSLVDPDNRRPVNYELREKYLEEIIQKSKKNIDELLVSLFSNYKDGKIKLYTIYKTLFLRNSNINLFREGSYIKLEPRGEKKRNIFAFARNYENSLSVIIVPRFCTELVNENELPIGEKVWQDTYIEIPSNNLKFRNAFTGEEIEEGGKICISNALKSFPVGLLVSH